MTSLSVSAKPCFAEWFINTAASVGNPTKHGMYVRTVRRTGRVNAGTFYELTDGEGDFWLVPVRFLVRRCWRTAEETFRPARLSGGDNRHEH